MARVGRSFGESSVAAERITGKYGYHLPFYRQQDKFAGSGWCPTRSTLLNILVAAEFVLRPLAEYRRRLDDDDRRDRLRRNTCDIDYTNDSAATQRWSQRRRKALLLVRL